MDTADDLRSNKISIRVTDETLAFINSFPGDRLSAKFDYMIERLKVIDQGNTALLSDSLANLQKDIAIVSKIIGYGADQQFDQETLLINEMLRKEGFKPEASLVKMIKQFNHLTNRMNTLLDMKNAYHHNIYSSEPAVDQVLKNIVNTFKAQEHEQIINIER